jgi:hypothetical protein
MFAQNRAAHLPHAKNLLEFFDTVDGKLTDEQRAAPKIVVNDQELRGMLSKRAKTLHLGTCARLVSDRIGWFRGRHASGPSLFGRESLRSADDQGWVAGELPPR